MSRLLRRKLVCFYCGCRSAQDHRPNTRKWCCEKCEAINHLDENGEIEDPPALDTFSNARYARPASPDLASTEDSLFCPTCIQNQHVLTESLASYFPPPDDPEYAKYEKEYPQYRKNLEDRYPQICEECEPRVRARIRVTGYAAKTDHLRRLMEQTRGSGIKRSVWGWKHAVAAVGEILWYMGLLGSFSWHLMKAVRTGEEVHGLRHTVSSLSLFQCLQREPIALDTAPDCGQVYNTAAGFALCLSLCSIWWNPRINERLGRNGGRIIGLGEYYKQQVIFLAVRFAAWAVLGITPSFDFDTRTAKAVHSFMLIFTVLSVTVSFRTVRVDYTPRVLFQDSPEPLISRRSQQDTSSIGHTHSYQPRRRRSLHNGQARAAIPPFHVSDLAPTPEQPLRPYRPLTPPSDTDESEAMDWTPSQEALRPAASYRDSKPTPAPVQPSPFYGRLPPDQVSQNHRLRNPPNRPTFQRASSPKRNNFFTRMVGNRNQDDVSGPDNEVTSQFAPPKFFPQSDYRADTGLESIFSTTFAIADEPAEIRTAREQEQRLTQQYHLHRSQSLTSSHLFQRIISVLLLGLSCLAWFRAPKVSYLTLPLRLAGLGVAAVVAGKGLLQVIQRPAAYRSFSDMLLFGCELGLSIFLGRMVKTSPSVEIPFATPDQQGLETVGMGLLIVMLVQEVWISVSEFRDVPPRPFTPQQQAASSISIPSPQPGQQSPSRQPTYPPIVATPTTPASPTFSVSSISSTVTQAPSRFHTTPYSSAFATPSISNASLPPTRTPTRSTRANPRLSAASGMGGLSLGGESEYGHGDGSVYGREMGLETRSKSRRW